MTDQEKQLKHLEIRIKSLERLVMQMQALDSAIGGGAFLSAFDLFAQVLETRGVVDRVEIGGRLREIVKTAREEMKAELAERAACGAAVPGFDSDTEAKRMTHELLDKLADRLAPIAPATTPAPPAKPKPGLRSIDGGRAGDAA